MHHVWPAYVGAHRLCIIFKAQLWAWNQIFVQKSPRMLPHTGYQYQIILPTDWATKALYWSNVMPMSGAGFWQYTGCSSLESSFDPPKRKGLEEDLGLRLAGVGETQRRKCFVIWHVSQLELMLHKGNWWYFVQPPPGNRSYKQEARWSLWSGPCLSSSVA